MKITREAGKGIKVIPASQARKDPEGRKAQRAVYLAQGYDGVRYENEEGVEVFHEGIYYDKDEIGMAFNQSMEHLEIAMKNARRPDEWAERYFKSANGVIEQMDRLTSVFMRMK